MKEKFAEDIRLDEEARIRRLKERDEYKQQIVEQAETKSRMYAEEKAAEVEARRKLEEEELFKARVVEAARQRLLKEHAASNNVGSPPLKDPGGLQFTQRTLCTRGQRRPRTAARA